MYTTRDNHADSIIRDYKGEKVNVRCNHLCESYIFRTNIIRHLLNVYSLAKAVSVRLPVEGVWVEPRYI